jgi:stage III sporulation protein SpoIIIAA
MIGTHRTCKCGAVYERSEHIAEEREISSFECAVCGATIENWNSCVYRKLKLGRSGDEVRPGWQVT